MPGILDEYDLNDGFDKGTLYIMRVYGHRTRMLSQFQALLSHADRNDRHGYLWTLVNILGLVFNMANEAGLATVLSAAYSLKHATDMEKSFPSPRRGIQSNGTSSRKSHQLLRDICSV